MTSRSLTETATKTMLFSEILSIAVDSFRTNKVRFALTALGMVIGTASLIMVTTIGLTGKQYVMNQIQAIGANLIYAYYEGGGNNSVNNGVRDDLTVEDMQAVQQEVPGSRRPHPCWRRMTALGWEAARNATFWCWACHRSTQPSATWRSWPAAFLMTKIPCRAEKARW